MIQIPPNKRWAKNPSSDVLASLYSEFNLDLNTNKGKNRVSPRAIITTDDITNLGVAIGFVRFNNATAGAGFYTIAGDRAFNTITNDPSAAFAVSAGTVTTHSSDTADIMFFRAANVLVATAQTKFYDLAATGAFTEPGGSPSFTSGTPHMLCEYATRCYVTEEFKNIWSFSSAFSAASSGTYTFNLNTYSSANVGLFIVDILEMSDGILILTSTQQQGEYARVLKWDGVTQNDPSAEYVLDTRGVMAGIIKGDVPYILTAEGELQVFNGGTFVRISNGRLPISKTKYLKNSFSGVNDRWIHPNGICVTEEGKINILISNQYEDGTFEERMPAGIYEFDLDNTDLGWYHKNSLSLYTASVTDFGQAQISRPGALGYFKTSNKAGSFLAGAQIYADGSATKEVIETNDTADTIQKFGYFITDKIYSQNVQESWEKVYARFKKFLTSTDKIWVKYRFDDPDSTAIPITWISTTSFSTTTNILGKEGYEVMGVQGTGSGFCAHITNIATSNPGGTFLYTATVDETFTGVTTGTGKAIVQNWKKASSFSNQVDKWNSFPIGKADTWVQLKVCMLFTGADEVDDLILINTKYQ